VPPASTSSDHRFVVLKHTTPADSARPTHWDLMLETDGVLRTWALPAEPAASETMIAESLADHRLAYLDYEGPIAGNRGDVARWDQGTWKLLALSEDQLMAELLGHRLIGRLTLARDGHASQRWRFSFEADLPTRGSANDSGST